MTGFSSPAGLRFGSTAPQPAVQGASTAQPLAGKGDDEIVRLLKAEAPDKADLFSTKYDGLALAKAYVPLVEGGPLTKMLKATGADAGTMVDLVSDRWIMTADSGHFRRGEQGLLLNPLLAQLVLLKGHGDLGKTNYRGEFSPEARKLFPVTYQVLNLKDAERSARLLRAAFVQPYPTAAGFVVDQLCKASFDQQKAPPYAAA